MEQKDRSIEQTLNGADKVQIIVTREDAEEAVKKLLLFYGEDITREGLMDTPKRYVKFFEEFLKPKEFTFTTFENEGIDQMITQVDIPFYSFCEHHLAPFFGVAKVSYIPDKRIVGLSKLARCVDLYANRLQNQERITTQIAERIQKELQPLGVGVQLKARHFCMEMRGVKKHDTYTITTELLGIYREQKVKEEFLNS